MTPPEAGVRALPRLGRPTGRDVVAGFVTGLFSIPEGMAYASIGGFNPVLGLYSGMAPTLVGAVFARTVLMTTTLTSAIALSSQSVLAQAGLDPTDLGNVAMLTLMVGAVMTVFGVFRLGSAMSFVSTAVMTGFTTGIALQIIAGVLKDATSYASDQHNTLLKIGDWAVHVQQWDLASTLVAVATVGVWFLARLFRPLKALALLISLAVVTLVVVIAGVDVETVGDIASIPNALPHPVLPNFAAAPHLITGAIAVSLVALAQAAGIGAAVPNPDGTRTSVSGDFVAQGLGNLAGGLTQALPTGGSLSRTGVATGAGARTRWSNIFAGAWLALIVLLVGKQAEVIPMPVIGGLVMVIGLELVLGRRKDIALVFRTAPLSAVAMVVTFLATTALPLQDAIFIGAGLSLVLFCVQVQRQARLVRLTRQPDGSWRMSKPPAEIPSGEVTVLGYSGAGIFAELERIDELWPDTAQTVNAAVVLEVRFVPEVPSATMVVAFGRWADRLRDRGCRLVLTGVNRQLAETLDRSGITARLGPENVVPATDVLLRSLENAYALGEAWVARDPDAPWGDGPKADQSVADQPDADRPEADQPEADQSVADRPGPAQPGSDRPGPD
ncbi:SulP family inorganic anion transporter [Microlunatus ginsengisoli]|uniref:SLC26A/SulP transporter domain-containing protein n=1 Tax=Microlunatus ginsengisoli TaxID=363863 RepID=A0ABP7APD1_9ACTN